MSRVATTSARALRLLSLLAAGRTRSAQELAERSGASRRTVRRDVETLRELGYAVETVHGAGGGYRLSAGGPLPPLVLAEDEVIAVVVALQTASATLQGLKDSRDRALTAVRQVVPRRLRASSEAFGLTVLPNQWEFPAPPLPVEVVREVGSAVRLRQLLHVRTGVGVQGLVEPHHLVVWAGRWYLVLFAPDEQSWRVVRVERIEAVTAVGRTFGDRDVPGGVVEFVRTTPDRGDVPAPWPCQGSAVLDVPAGLAAQFAPGGAVVEDVPGQRARLRMGAWSWIGLAGLYLSFGADLHDVEPAELRAAFDALGHRISRLQG